MWGKRHDMVVHEEAPYNAEPAPMALAGHQVTDVDTFYVRNHGPVPDLDPTGWRLRVGGLVDEELTFSLTDLREQFEQQRVMATMQCAGNRRAGFIEVRDIPGEDPWGGCATGTAWWTGVRLRDVIQRAGVRSEGAHVAFDAPDVSEIPVQPEAYAASIPLAKALAPEVLLAWAMNDRDLAPVHGAPVRVVVPGFIGARSVKWVQRLTVQAHPSEGYFQATAYRVLPAEADPSLAGPGDGISLTEVALNSEILTPSQDAVVAAGQVEVTGYAHAGGGRYAARVDLSVDGGETWIQADLDPGRAWTWRLWRASVAVPAGPCRITARAWDSSGAGQPESAAALWNPKGYVNNSWATVDVTAR